MSREALQAQEGDHYVSVTVDADNEVVETNEGNNTASSEYSAEREAGGN